jgi:hypothetical protein
VCPAKSHTTKSPAPATDALRVSKPGVRDSCRNRSAYAKRHQAQIPNQHIVRSDVIKLSSALSSMKLFSDEARQPPPRPRDEEPLGANERKPPRCKVLAKGFPVVTISRQHARLHHDNTMSRHVSPRNYMPRHHRTRHSVPRQDAACHVTARHKMPSRVTNLFRFVGGKPTEPRSGERTRQRGLAHACEAAQEQPSLSPRAPKSLQTVSDIKHN